MTQWDLNNNEEDATELRFPPGLLLLIFFNFPFLRICVTSIGTFVAAGKNIHKFGVAQLKDPYPEEAEVNHANHFVNNFQSLIPSSENIRGSWT